jgi:NTE family protein
MTATQVAIACQGGGSHTAFTGGVLTELLRAWDDDRFDLVGLSGASGGALNAVATWHGLQDGGPDRAIELLDAIWTDIAADSAMDRMTNRAAVWARRAESNGFLVPQLSPYLNPASSMAREELTEIIERHIDFDILADQCRAADAELVIGTVDVNAGEFETFTNEDITVDALLASSAVPDLFRAVEIDGHYHWDGLFSQNPPIRDLMRVPPDRKPDELWVVQINPQRRSGEPTELDAIADRRNELAGNISLNQELRFVETVNEWLDAGHLPADEFSQTAVHRLQLDAELHCSTKLDRSQAFIDDLWERGATTAADFLASRATESPGGNGNAAASNGSVEAAARDAVTEA